MIAMINVNDDDDDDNDDGSDSNDGDHDYDNDHDHEYSHNYDDNDESRFFSTCRNCFSQTALGRETPASLSAPYSATNIILASLYV